MLGVLPLECCQCVLRAGVLVGGLCLQLLQLRQLFDQALLVSLELSNRRTLRVDRLLCLALVVLERRQSLLLPLLLLLPLCSIAREAVFLLSEALSELNLAVRPLSLELAQQLLVAYESRLCCVCLLSQVSLLLCMGSLLVR